VSEDIVYGLRQAVRIVPGLGLCVVDAPSGALDRLLATTYTSTEDSFAFVNVLLSQTLRVPSMSYDDVAALPEETRRILREACAEAARLDPERSAGLIPEESDQALRAAIEVRRARVLVQARTEQASFLTNLLEGWGNFGVQLRHALHGNDVVQVLDAWAADFRETLDELQRDLDEIEQHPLFWVVEDLAFIDTRRLLLEQPDEIERVVLERVIRPGELVDAVGAAVAAAPYLQDAQRDDLRHGLAALRRDDPFACRRIQPGLEGALWRTAAAQGVIDDRRYMLRSRKQRQPYAKNVSSILSEDGGLAVSRELASFLLKAVFGPIAQDVRHGRADEGHRGVSVWSFLGLIGWLDAVAGTDLRDDVTQRLDAALSSDDLAA
jgi:hypothetical protein